MKQIENGEYKGTLTMTNVRGMASNCLEDLDRLEKERFDLRWELDNEEL